MSFTLSKEVAEKLIGTTTNMSAFVDKTLRAVLFQEPSEIVIIIPGKWTGGDLNPRPLPCQGSALPAELPAHTRT